MKIRILLFSMLSFLTLSSQAQDVLARLDLGRKDPKPTFFEYSPVDGGLVTLGPTNIRSSRYLGLVKYDADLNEVWKREVLEQTGRKNVDFVSVIGTHILVFTSEFFPSEGVIKTFYYSYDLDGTPLVEEGVLSVVPNQKEQKVDLQYVLSPNKRRLLAYKNLANRRESEAILYFLFDEDGEVVQNGEIDLKYPDNKFSVTSLRVSNEGNVFVLGKFDRTSLPTSSSDFQYIIYRYDLEQRDGVEMLIDIGGRYISDLAFRLDREENMYVAGFYSNRSTDQIAGVLLQKLSPTGELIQQSLDAFSEGFLSNYLSQGQINRGRELRNFYLDPEDGIILRSDGGVLMIAEKFYVTYQSYRDMYGGWVERPQYHYEDVIFTSVAPDGSIEWHSIVDKNQVSESPQNLSYFSAIGPMGSFIFYEYKPQRLPINVYYNNVAIDGQVSDRNPVFPDFRYGDAFFPRESVQINSEEALLVYLSNRGRNLSVVKVKIGS